MARGRLGTVRDPPSSDVAESSVEGGGTRLMYAAASMYYEQDATQAQIADRLGTSRATVSRLLSDARARGVVRIEVVRPTASADDLADRLAEALGLDRVYIEPDDLRRPEAPLSTAVAQALSDARLLPGDVLLVSSGQIVFEAARGDLPQLPGVVVAPTIGGQDEAEAWFQTNDVTRMVAHKLGGRPIFLFGPALPSAELHASLMEEPSIRRVIALWESATCALVGIGSPLLTRSSIPTHLPATEPALIRAIGDISSRFFLRDGRPVDTRAGSGCSPSP